jgi:glycosyltransferase involved in cell wall biosynthesis
VPPRWPEQRAASVAELLADPARRRRMGAAGRERVVAAYDWREIARKTEATYQRIVRSTARRGVRVRVRVRAVAP